jgi:hypothetical protein
LSGAGRQVETRHFAGVSPEFLSIGYNGGLTLVVNSFFFIFDLVN